MTSKALSRATAEILVPLACLAVVAIGYWAYSQRGAGAEPPPQATCGAPR